MLLRDMKFEVHINKEFVRLTKAQLPQIAWFVREVAKEVDSSMWQKNLQYSLQDEQLDCWLHPILIDDLPATLEALPFPQGKLLLSVQGHYKTLPLDKNKEDILILNYPDDFEQFLNMSEEELKIFRADKVAVDGQNRRFKFHLN